MSIWFPLMQNKCSLITATLLCGALFLTPSNAAWAQAVPGSADSARIKQSVETLKAPSNVQQPSIKAPKQIAISAPDGADRMYLDLKQIIIDGMTVYSKADVSELYSEFLNKKIPLTDIFGIAEALTTKYRNEGYILSQVVIPPQTIDDGIVRLQVVEGYIDDINVESPSSKHTNIIHNLARKIKDTRPLNAKILERYLLLLNDIPGLNARSVLSPSTTQPGAADLTIITEQKPFDLFSQLDNRGSRYLGPLQINSTAQINGFFGYQEMISVQVVTAPDHHPQRELDFLSLGYSQNIGAEGTVASVNASITSTSPGFELSEFDVRGTSRSLSFALTHPFIRSRTDNLNMSLRLDINNTKRHDNVTIDAIEDRLRVIRLGGNYQFADRFIGINVISAEISRGLDILNARKRDSANLTRARGRPEFTKATASIMRIQRLSQNFELFASVSGQKSSDILLSGEEFGIGGVAYGGAYDGSEIIGEEGLAGKLELRYNSARTPSSAQGYQLFTYYDVGRVWDWDNTAVRDRIRSLASIGMGIRVDINKNISGSAEVALPLTRTIDSEGNKDPRFFFTLSHKL